MTLARFEISSKKLQTKIIVNKFKFSFTMFNEPRKTTENAKNLLVARVLLLFMHRPWWFDEKNIMHDIFLGECFQGSVFEEKILSWANFSSFSNCICNRHYLLCCWKIGRQTKIPWNYPHRSQIRNFIFKWLPSEAQCENYEKLLSFLSTKIPSIQLI